jgi:hypothetical protein
MGYMYYEGDNEKADLEVATNLVRPNDGISIVNGPIGNTDDDCKCGPY